MKEMLRLIESFIPEAHTINLNKNKGNDNLMHYDLLNKKENNIGYIKLTSSGELNNYAYLGETFNHIKHPLTEESIAEKANLFLKTFFDEPNLGYSSLFTYLNKYEVNYEKKDTKYNLFLPGTGFKLILNQAGDILSADKENDKYQVVYPKKLITKEEAKQYYLNKLDLDLKISKPRSHGHYQLVYRINEGIINVPASGRETDLKLTKQQLRSIEPFTISSENLFRILGLDGNYARIGKKNKKDARIELWSKYPKKTLMHLNYDINEPQQDVIKYKINKHTNQIVQICDGDILREDVNEVITSKKAFDRALDFLFTVYPKANEFFDILELVTDTEDENDQKYEANYIFYFNRVHDSIEVENQIAYIGVGKYTGIINKFCAPTVTEKELAHINVFADVSEPEAVALYASELEMNLGFVKKVNEIENIKYELTYFPIFSNGKSSDILIDAHQGTIYDI